MFQRVRISRSEADHWCDLRHPSKGSVGHDKGNCKETQVGTWGCRRAGMISCLMILDTCVCDNMIICRSRLDHHCHQVPYSYYRLITVVLDVFSIKYWQQGTDLDSTLFHFAWFDAGTAWHCMALHGTAWHCMALHPTDLMKPLVTETGRATTFTHGSQPRDAMGCSRDAASRSWGLVVPTEISATSATWNTRRGVATVMVGVS